MYVWLPLLRDHFVMFPFAQVSRETRRVIWRRRGTVGGGGRNVQRSGNKENRTKMGFTRNMSACRVYISPLYNIIEGEKKSSSVNTGKSLSEALIIASTNPQYEDRFFIELQDSSIHENS